MQCFNVLPSRNSMARKGWPFSSPISWIVQILGWLRAEAAFGLRDGKPLSAAGLWLHLQAET